MSNSILNTVINAVKSIAVFVIIANFKIKMIVSKFSRDSYPEIRKYCPGNIITTQAVKAFLYDNGLLSLHNYQNPKCDYTPIANGLYIAFCRGLLSLNATKQTGVLNNTPIRLSTSAENYLRIAAANETAGFRFALWTKNPAYLAAAIDKYGKPENLSTVWSMSRVNVMDNNPDRWNKYFDHRFIVVEDQDLKDNYIARNGFYPCKCGKRSCITCQECYTRRDSIETAVELLRK